jgi:MFS family permease
VWDLLRNGELRRAYAIGILLTTSWDTFLFLTPIYCSQLHIPASVIGVIIASFSIAAMLIRLFVRPLALRFTPWQLIIASLTLAGAGNFAFGFAATVPLLLLFAFATGLGQGMATPMISTIMYEASPPGRVTEVIGLRLTIAKGYQTVLPLVTGSVGTLIGIGPAFWMVAGLMLGGSYLVRGKWRASRRAGG